MLITNNFLKQASLFKPTTYLGNKSLLRSLDDGFFASVKFLNKPLKRKIAIFPTYGKLNFELLNVFYTLVICGNVTLTSERLSISQPAVSLCIKKLEKQTGTLLFHKLNSRKLIKLTAPGLILFNYIQRLFQILQESLDISNCTFFNLYDQNSQVCKLKKDVHNTRSSLSSLQVNKKFFYSKDKFLTLHTFSNSIKNILEIKSINLEYFETQSKLLLLKTKTNSSYLSNLSISFSNDKMNFRILEIEKINSLQQTNITSANYFKNRNLIEVQTSKGLNACLELKISNLIYWGSES